MDEAALRERLLALEARVAELEQRLAQRPQPRVAPAPEPQAAPRSEPRAVPPPPSMPPPVPPPLPGAGRPRASPPVPGAATGSAPAVDPLDPVPLSIAGASPFAPSPATRARRERAAGGRHRNGDGGFERFVGLTVLGRVGMAALLVAAAYFGQLGWERLGPGARAAIVYAFGLLLVGAGAWLRPRVAARYVALLWGGGVACTYLGGVLAHLRFHVLPSPVAVVSLLGSAALGQFLARRLGLEALATVALGGAYAAPVLVGTPSPTPTAFFVLLLTLHGWAAWIEHRWRWHSARALAVVATIMLVLGWYEQHGTVSAWSFVLHVLAVWLGLTAPELVRAMRREPLPEARAALVALALLAAQLGVFGVSIARDALHAVSFVLALLAVLGGALLVPRAALLGTAVARVGSLLLAPAFVWWSLAWQQPRGFDELAGVRLGGLLAIAMALLATRRWTGVADLGASVAAICATLLATSMPVEPSTARACAVLAVATAVCTLVAGAWQAARTLGLVLGALTAFVAVRPPATFAAAADVGWLVVAFAGSAAIVVVGAAVARRRGDGVLAAAAAVVATGLAGTWLAIALARPFAADAAPVLPLLANARVAGALLVIAGALAARALLPGTARGAAAALAAVALATTWCTGLLELLGIAADWTFGARAVATSLYSLAFAALLLVAGFRQRVPALRWTALAAFAVVVVKIAAHDLRGLDTPLRVLATGVLGAVLLVAAWGYAKVARGAGDGGDGGDGGGDGGESGDDRGGGTPAADAAR